MRRIRRFVLATAIGLLGASVALAQGTPQPLPGAPGTAAQPKPAATQPAAPAQPAPTHFGTVTAAPVMGANGCAGGTVGCAAPCATDCGPKCGTPLLRSGLGRTVGRIATAPLIGSGCASPIGCSNLAAERTFLFGSCRQFFNPGNKCGIRGGCTGGGIGGCHGPCDYGSYLNR